jgi:hypothetical protein
MLIEALTMSLSSRLAPTGDRVRRERRKGRYVGIEMDLEARDSCPFRVCRIPKQNLGVFSGHSLDELY